MTDFGASQGGGFGQGARSPRLGRSQRGDPRERRAANAQRTVDSVGAGLGRDALGRTQVDVDALLADASFMAKLEAALVARGFTRS
jgi:hypothetical protein